LIRQIEGHRLQLTPDTCAPRHTFASPTVEMLFRLMEQPGPHAVRFSIFGGYGDRPRQGQRCTMPVAPSPDEQRMTPGSKWTKGQRIPKFRRVETFLWRCLIDSSISIVGHPYPPSDYWEAVLSGSIRAETRRGLREIERHLRAN
jgi:hypothetical protein